MLCELCKKNPGQICEACATNLEEALACMSVFQHLASVIVCLINFQFKGMFIQLSWAVERLLHIGDYSTGGYFDQCGYRWRDGLKWF